MEWREFFYFNRSDRSVVLSIIVFAAVVWLLAVLFDNTDEVGKIGTVVSQDSVGYKATAKGFSAEEDAKPYYYNVGDEKLNAFRLILILLIAHNFCVLVFNHGK